MDNMSRRPLHFEAPQVQNEPQSIVVVGGGVLLIFTLNCIEFRTAVSV